MCCSRIEGVIVPLGTGVGTNCGVLALDLGAGVGLTTLGFDTGGLGDVSCL